MSIDAFITRLHASGKPLIMGILNRTPDSFSNKGHEATIEDALQMIREGADLLDVGGESTRPGAEEVQADEEIRRTVPYIRALRAQTDLPISIDTLVREGRATVKVLPTGDKWYGMTYAADRKSVEDALADMTAAGFYPRGLWKNA